MSGPKLVVYMQSSISSALLSTIQPPHVCACVCVYSIVWHDLTSIAISCVHQDPESCLILYLCSPTQDELCKNVKAKPLHNHEQACAFQPHLPLDLWIKTQFKKNLLSAQYPLGPVLRSLTNLHDFIFITIPQTIHYYHSVDEKQKFRKVEQHDRDTSPRRSFHSKCPGLKHLCLCCSPYPPLTLSPSTVPQMCPSFIPPCL